MEEDVSDEQEGDNLMSVAEAAKGTQRRLGYKLLAVGLPQKSVTMIGNPRDGYRFKINFRTEEERRRSGLGDEYEGVPLDITVG